MEDELKKKIRADPIEKLQNHFVELSRIYVTALRQCSQGGLAVTDEEDVDASKINKVVHEALTLIEDLSEVDEKNEKSLAEFVKEDEKLNIELQASKVKAEQALQKIKQLRNNLADVVIKN